MAFTASGCQCDPRQLFTIPAETMPRNCGTALRSEPLNKKKAAEAAFSFIARKNYAFSNTRDTVQDLVLENGRHALISTRSPILAVLVSSWAWYFCDLVTTLP